VLSLHILSSRGADGHGEWRQAVTEDLRAMGLMPQLRLLVALNLPTGYFPTSSPRPRASAAWTTDRGDRQHAARGTARDIGTLAEGGSCRPR
jgi:hypothetical protein